MGTALDRSRRHSLRWALAANLAWLVTATSSAAGAEDLTPYYGAPVSAPAATEIAYSEFLEQVEQGQVSDVVIAGERIRGELGNGSRFFTVSPETDNHAMIAALIEHNVKVSGERRADAALPIRGPLYALPFLLIAGWLYFTGRPRRETRGSSAMSFGKSRARRLEPGEVKITLNDVAGVEEAKEEVAELVAFLKDPAKFEQLGGRIPRGVLMAGAPGTGKTLLAKAIAGEAGVPFFTISGADFVEMYVGVGASRVRDLFDEAEKHAPCIIFIDEIDAVGRRRTEGLTGGQDEREQTLNQLLVRMDGIEGNKGVIVIAATNRPDVLDPALLRPGRFDRQVVVPLPDVRGREQIVRVHMRGLPLADDVDPGTIARAAPGFSGADLANLVNEAALFAARSDKHRIEQIDFERAKDKLVMGAERHSLAMSEQEKRLTAYHEAGHAIVSLHVPDHDPVYKVSIVPRGRALGLTVYLPEADRHSHTKTFLDSRICSLFGGRIAEALIFGEDMITTGAANDIQCATQIARNMVIRYGMSGTLGPLAYCDDDGQAFLGARALRFNNLSNATACAIDRAVRDIIDRNYARAKAILESHLDPLHRMAGALIRYETIDRGQIQAILQGREPGPPASWKEHGGVAAPHDLRPPREGAEILEPQTAREARR